MPDVHMICGPIGAGKTTVARRIAAARGAIRFSLDEWVTQSFGPEVPDPMQFEWWAERCNRCSEHIWSICQDLLALQLDVVLDFGFPRVAHRDEYRRRAMQMGATVHLHVVTADAALRWRRVQERNLERPETFALVLTENMFAGSEVWWEPPSDAEFTGPVTTHTPQGTR